MNDYDIVVGTLLFVGLGLLCWRTIVAVYKDAKGADVGEPLIILGIAAVWWAFFHVRII